ncbi:PAS domain-containing protein, partial [Azospirillum brasilense]|nr:PAS domain-containing protein [Azospirillum brasilense]
YKERGLLIPAEGEGGDLVLTLAGDGGAPQEDSGFFGLEDLLGDRAGEAERAIMQAIAVPLVVTRLSDGLVMAVNQPAGLLFEVPLDDVVGRSFAKAFYTDPAERERLLSALCDGAGGVDGFETRLCRPDGSDLWAMVSARRFRFRGEDAMLACISDISARKRTEQALEAQWDQSRAVLNGLGQGVMAFDRGLRLVAWNGRVTELLGVEPEFLSYHTPYAAIARRVGQGVAFGPGSVCPDALTGSGTGPSAALAAPLPARPRPGGAAPGGAGRRPRCGSGSLVAFALVRTQRRFGGRWRRSPQRECGLAEPPQALTCAPLILLSHIVAGRSHLVRTHPRHTDFP